MLQKFVGVAILLMLVFAFDSCVQKTDRYDKTDKVIVIDSTQIKMQALQDSVINYQKQARAAVARAEEVSARCDSISIENQTLRAENEKLKAQLAQARDEVIPAMRQQYEGVFTQQQTAIKQKEEIIQGLVNDKWQLTNDIENLRGDNAALQTELNNLKPWASKWQKDSKRSFIKVMFGAGKAPVPDVPTPQLE